MGARSGEPARLFYLRELSGKAARIKERAAAIHVETVEAAPVEGAEPAAPKEKITGRGKRQKKKEIKAAAGA
jgi:hypothetical protein